MEKLKECRGVAAKLYIGEIIMIIISCGFFLSGMRAVDRIYMGGWWAAGPDSLGDYIIIAATVFWLAFAIYVVILFFLQLGSSVIIYSNAVKINAVVGKSSSTLIVNKKSIQLTLQNIQNVFSETRGIYDHLVIETTGSVMYIQIKNPEEIVILINQLKQQNEQN